MLVSLEIMKSSKVRLRLRKKKMQWSGRIISYQRRSGMLSANDDDFLAGYLVTTEYFVLVYLLSLVIDISSISGT